jgi:hypothetical protein
MSSYPPYVPNKQLDLLKKKLQPPGYPRALAATPPTITELTDYAVSTIANKQFVQLPDARVSGNAAMGFAFSAALNDGINHNFQYSVANLWSGSPQYWCLEFVTDAPRIEVLGFQSVFANLFVDDLPCQAGFYNPVNSNARHLMQIDFAGVRQSRKIRLEGNLGSGGVAGFYIGANDILFPASQSVPAFAFIGDSYCQKSGGLSGVSDIAAQTAWNLGGKCVFIDAVGGTGFAQNNSGASPTPNNYSARLGVSTTGAVAADVFFVLGGINDLATLTSAQVLTVLTGIRSLYPNAVIVVAGNWCPDPLYSRISPSAKQSTIAATILAAVKQLTGSWVYISNLDDSWLNSSGASKAATGIAWQTGDGAQLAFTAAPSAATSATLTDPFGGPTGTYTLIFGDLTTTKSVTLTNGSTAVSWTGAVTQTSATAGAYKTTQGNSLFNLSDDWTHPSVPAGVGHLAHMLAQRAYDGIMAL